MPISQLSAKSYAAKVCLDYLSGTPKLRGLPLLPTPSPQCVTLSHIKEFWRGFQSADGYERRQAPVRTPRRKVHPWTVLQTRCLVQGFAKESSQDGASGGPLMEYDARVQQGRLQDDPYQRRTLFPRLIDKEGKKS